MKEVHDRVDGFLRVFLPEVERKYPGKHSSILLVSHAATAIALARELLGDRELTLRVGCCTLSDFTRMKDAIDTLGGWTAGKLADGTHLTEGAAREWGFEDIEIAHGKVSCLIFSLLIWILLTSARIGHRRPRCTWNRT